MPKSSTLHQRCEQYHTRHGMNTKCYQRPHNLRPDGKQQGKRGRGVQGGENVCEAQEKGDKGKRIGKGEVREEKAGWRKRRVTVTSSGHTPGVNTVCDPV